MDATKLTKKEISAVRTVYYGTQRQIRRISPYWVVELLKA
jgi:hypothetical protein